MTIAMGFLSWLFVSRAIKITDSSTWAVPMALFALYAVLLCLSIVLVKEGLYVNIAAAVSMLFSVIFARSLWHFAIFVLCVFMMHMAISKIRNDLNLNVKISLWKSFGTGKFWFVISLAILISSQYFFIVKEIDGQKKIPEFDTSAISSKMVGPVMGMMNPDFEKIQQEGLTVDQFIIESQSNDDNQPSFDQEALYEQIPQDLPEKEKENLKKQISNQSARIFQSDNQIVLQEGRKQLSEMVGRDVSGDEKIADVFSGIIDKKINDFFQRKSTNNEKSFLLEYVFTAVLFFTVWPLGSILCSACFLIVIILFKLFVHFEIVKIDKTMVEREVIA